MLIVRTVDGKDGPIQVKASAEGLEHASAGLVARP